VQIRNKLGKCKEANGLVSKKALKWTQEKPCKYQLDWDEYFRDWLWAAQWLMQYRVLKMVVYNSFANNIKRNFLMTIWPTSQFTWPTRTILRPFRPTWTIFWAAPAAFWTVVGFRSTIAIPTTVATINNGNRRGSTERNDCLCRSKSYNDVPAATILRYPVLKFALLKQDSLFSCLTMTNLAEAVTEGSLRDMVNLSSCSCRCGSGSGSGDWEVR
jgi:hypothetical protein